MKNKKTIGRVPALALVMSTLFLGGLASQTASAIAVAHATVSNPVVVKEDGSVAVGDGAYIENYTEAEKPASIAIGSNARVITYLGLQEALLDFNDAMSIKSFLGIPYGGALKDASKLVGSIAIGENVYARTGSTIIGNRVYSGKMGDYDSLDLSEYRDGTQVVYTTSVGTNSVAEGAMSSLVGAYSIMSNPDHYSYRNFGAAIFGSLNSIESLTGGSTSGIGNSIVGVANREKNSNGALIFGAGNVIENSYQNMNVGALSSGSLSAGDAKDAQGALIEMISKNEAGSALAIGGANMVKDSILSQTIGVGNSLSNGSAYSLLDGYRNRGSAVKYVTVIGSGNSVSDSSHTVLLGDSRVLNKADNAVVIGSSDKDQSKTVASSGAVAVGHNASVTVNGGAAVGENSVAAVDKGAAGYDPLTKAASAETASAWVSTDAAFSVGDGDTVTRQITGVAAGTNDTDAVNVAQLKKISESTFGFEDADGNKIEKMLGNTVKVTGDGNILAAVGGDGLSLSLNKKITLGGVTIDGTNAGASTVQVGNVKIDSATNKISGIAAGDISSASTDAVNGSQLYQLSNTISNSTFGLEDENGTKVEKTLGNAISVKGDGQNISVAAENGGLKVSLGDEISVNSVTAANTVQVGNVKIDSSTNKITGLAAGSIAEGSTDAVNGGQIYQFVNSQMADSSYALSDDAGTVVSSTRTEGPIQIRGEGGNIKVTADPNGGKSLGVSLSDDISVKTVTAEKVILGDTTVSSSGLSIAGGPSVTSSGVYAGGSRVTGVAAGTVSATSTDAVNGSQLYATNRQVESNTSAIERLANENSDLDKRISRAGANAAALAALHPIEYDEDHPMTAAVGLGRYRGHGALAVGVFLRPTPNLLLSVGGSFANESNMVNAGLSYRFGDDDAKRYVSKQNLVQNVSLLQTENRSLAAQLSSANMKLESDAKTIQELKAEIETIKKALFKNAK